MQNEKRKDKELTEQIQRILKQRDEVMKGADIGMWGNTHLTFFLIVLCRSN